MRRWMVLVMILLLPLRVWAGDLMSVRMAAVATPAQTSAAMPADCHMLTQQGSADAGDGAGRQAPAGMENCMSCELCIPVAEVACTGLEAVSFARHALPLAGGVAFASAPPAPAFKPPIS